MKSLSAILTALLLSVSVFSQSPQNMSYQAVIRDASNNLVTNHVIGIRISILQGSISGTVVYTEPQTTNTNENGLISIEIGSGIGFDAINWSNNSYFIKTEIDPTGGTSYTITGISQLLSVPFALYAKTAGNGFSGNYDDLTNKPILFNGTWADISGKPTTTGGYGITNAMTTLHPANAITQSNITNWETAYGWGNHAGLYRSISYVPTWGEITGKPSGNNKGDMQYWDGSAWVMVPAGQPGQFLQLSSSNVPGWSGAAFSTITTATVSSISTTSATCGGNVVNNGGAIVTAYGICWNTSENPTISNNKTTDGSGTGTFTSSVTGLTPGTTYYLRAYASNSAGTAYGNEVSFTTTSIVNYSSHTISIDGINDFVVADEQFNSTSTGYNAYFAWDANYFYIGYKGTDIGISSSSRWLAIYLDGTPGTTTGMTLNTQTPTLPFVSKYLFLWRTSNDFFGSWVYNGSSWSGPTAVSISDYNKSNNYIEMRISRASLGNPSKVKVHLNMLNEAPGSEWTYGGVPGNSFNDSYNPGFLHYYQFDFTNTIKPVDYVPQ